MKFRKAGMLFGTLVLSIGLLTACGGGKNAAPAPAPAEQPAGEGTAGNADLVAQGEEVVNKNCLGCHGNDLQGGMGGQAPSLVTSQLDKEGIIEVLKDGRGNMPSGTAAGNEEAVAEYLLSIR